MWPEKAEAVLAANNETPPVTIQANTLRKSGQEVAEALTAEGVEVKQHEVVPDCMNLLQTGNIEKLKAFRQGWFWVQDAASMLAVTALNPKPGDSVLDICSAPGGKSFAAAVLSGGKARITSLDISERKLKLVQDGAERMGMDIRVGKSDATVFVPEYAGSYDRIICDVPCSGLGIIRKKPDIRYAGKERRTGCLSCSSGSEQCFKIPEARGTAALAHAPEDRKTAGSKAIPCNNRDFELAGFELPPPLGRIDSKWLHFGRKNFI